MSDEEEIEIEYKPIRRLVILESTELPQRVLLERLATIFASEQQSLTLNWAEGIFFIAAQVDHQSDRIVEDLLKGTVYWSSVFYAKMPSYQKFAKIGALEFPIIDQTHSSFVKQAARWLKKESEREQSKELS